MEAQMAKLSVIQSWDLCPTTFYPLDLFPAQSRMRDAQGDLN
jgi:hypothetical protein